MQEYDVLGLMSGTSVDGLDMAHCTFWKTNGQWNYQINKAETIEYDSVLEDKLRRATLLNKAEHDQLHLDFGVWLGKQSMKFLERYRQEVLFVASHGHTSHHRPEEGFTFQLGDGQLLANASGQKVICDFRTQDVELGGQGAPLVPIGDELLFTLYDYCLNLGGISNISFRKGGQRIAFDIGLANMPLDFVAKQMGIKMDRGGEIARKGKLITELFDELNQLAYYNMAFPKSTGIEWFQSSVVPLMSNYLDQPEDLLHTLVEHNCCQIGKVLRAQNSNPEAKMLVTGGGAFNDFFMERLAENCGSVKLVVPNKEVVSFKEAMVFAFMGLLRHLNEVNVLASVTGSKKDSSSGRIFWPA